MAQPNDESARIRDVIMRVLQLELGEEIPADVYMALSGLSAHVTPDMVCPELCFTYNVPKLV